MLKSDNPTAPYGTLEEFVQAGVCTNRHEAESIWAFWRTPPSWRESVKDSDRIAEAPRFLPDGSGFTFEEIREFPECCIHLAKENKNQILSGYFDLLYYEYRERAALGNVTVSAMIVLVAILFVVFHEHALATAIVLSLLGIGSAIVQSLESQQFAKYRESIQGELKSLGVGIRHEQLHTLISFSRGDSSGRWGKIHSYPISGLGVVRPVNFESHAIWGDHVFALSNDNVYR